MFAASTSLLPSSFAMYMVTWAAAGVLKARPAHVVVPAVVCVTLGWPVAGQSLNYAAYLSVFDSLLTVPPQLREKFHGRARNGFEWG